MQACLDTFTEVGSILSTPVCEGGETILDFAKKGLTQEEVQGITQDFADAYDVEVADKPPLAQGMSLNEYVSTMYACMTRQRRLTGQRTVTATNWTISSGSFC